MFDREGLRQEFRHQRGIFGTIEQIGKTVYGVSRVVRDVKHTVDVLRGKDRPHPHPRPRPYPTMSPWGRFDSWRFEMMERFNRYVAMHPWHVRPMHRRPSPIFAHRHDHYR